MAKLGEISHNIAHVASGVAMPELHDYVDDVAEQAELTVWVSAEYEAGHAARLSGLARSESETVCWRMGWQDADSLTQEARDQDALDQTARRSARVLGRSLYALGRIARANGLPFGVDSPEAWKHGWIQMDIHLGISDPRNAPELILLA
jgi:hypothetical protein